MDRQNEWIGCEAARLINYQHQHRGLSFTKLFLPPTTDKTVNLIGIDNHVYRGIKQSIPEDQLPPDVDPKSIDEEALFKEIFQMRYPKVPTREPLGPSRRIGGSYTLQKRVHLSPVEIQTRELNEENLLGENNQKVTMKTQPKPLSEKILGTKRPRKYKSTSHEFVQPTVVTLQSNGGKGLLGRKQTFLMELPASSVYKIIEIIRTADEKTDKLKSQSEGIHLSSENTITAEQKDMKPNSSHEIKSDTSEQIDETQSRKKSEESTNTVEDQEMVDSESAVQNMTETETEDTIDDETSEAEDTKDDETSEAEDTIDDETSEAGDTIDDETFEAEELVEDEKKEIHETEETAEDERVEISEKEIHSESSGS